jgi:Tol biopolymer transport system component/serine/threonine protein kinase
MAKMIGKTISHYKIIEKLGGGGMGVVYKAHDEKLDRFVALKFLSPHLSADEEVKQRFMAEAKAASALDHTNICTVFEIQETEDGQMFIAMAFYDGETLKKKMEQDPPNIDETIKIGIQIAEGLSKAHSRSIIHRDIKPANVMVTEEGLVKIVDFGLAKIADARITKTGWTLGTAAYMSPEQARGETVDNRTDIWSLGVILYEMATGQSPFKGENAQSVIYSILNDAPTPPTMVHGEIPAELESVIVRCLEKDRENRFSDTGEVGAELKKVIQQISGPDTGTAVMVRKIPQPNIKTRVISAAAVVTAVVVVAYFIFQLFFGTQPIEELKIGRATQVTHSPDLEIDPVISPDGKIIAYAAGVEGEMDIYVRQVSGGRAIALTADMPGSHRWPQWSPDGMRIAFQSSNKAYVVPALGGAPRILIEDVTHLSLAWSPEGMLIAHEQNNSLLIRDLGTEGTEKILEAHDPHSLSFSPDGSLLTYVSGNPDFIRGNILGNIAPSSVWVVPLSGGEPDQIREAQHLNTSPVWTPDGKHILFISDQDGNRDVYQLELDDSGKPVRPPVRLTTGLDAHSIDISRDGKFLVCSKFNYKTNIWSLRIPAGGSIAAAEAKPVTNGNQAIEGHHVSIDGEWLVFDSNRAGNQDIYKMPVSGGEPMQLTTHPSNDYYPALSPDGQEIAFYSLRNGNRDVFVMSADGGSLQQVTQHEADDIEPDWSPDGNQLVFFSARTGQDELYVVARKDKKSPWESPRQVTTEGGSHAKWSPDGSMIAYVHTGRLQLYSLEESRTRLLFLTEDSTKIPYPLFLDWSADSRAVFFKGFDSKRNASFWSVPVTGGAPRLLVRFGDPSQRSARSEFTSDGRNLFFTITENESDIWLLELLREQK